MDISKEEFAALERALFDGTVGRPEGVHSTAELAVMFGISETGMRKRIREAIKNGTMEQVKFIGKDTIGRRHPRIGYKMVSDKD